MNLNPYAGPEAEMETADRGIAPSSWRRFHSPRIPGGATIALIGVFMIVLLNSAWACWSQSRLAKRVLNRAKVTEAQILENDQRMRQLRLVRIAVFCTTLGVFVFWLFRAHGNLHSFGVEQLRLPSVVVAALCLMPIVNLYWPYRVICDIWKASDVDYIGPRSARWRKAPTHEMFLVWWVFELVWVLASWLIPPFPGRHVFWQHGVEQLRTISQWQMAVDLIGLPSCAMLCLIVLLIDERQFEARDRALALVAEDMS